MHTIGVLALQGAIEEHIRAIESCGERAIPVKNTEQLAELDGLIIPGGESTTMRKLIDEFELMEPLRQFAASRKPIFGTCAGLILLAKKIVGYEQPHLGLMDVTVERNSFGRQKESFEAEVSIVDVADDFPAVFIRAPHIVDAGENVEILAKYNDRIVVAREGQYLGCSFHPELTDDPRLTKYFVGMVEEYKKTKL